MKGCQIQPYQIETLPQLHKSFDILEHTVTKTWPLGQSRRVEIILEGPVSLDQRGYYWWSFDWTNAWWLSLILSQDPDCCDADHRRRSWHSEYWHNTSMPDLARWDPDCLCQHQIIFPIVIIHDYRGPCLNESRFKVTLLANHLTMTLTHHEIWSDWLSPGCVVTSPGPAPSW